MIYIQFIIYMSSQNEESADIIPRNGITHIYSITLEVGRGFCPPLYSGDQSVSHG